MNKQNTRKWIIVNSNIQTLREWSSIYSVILALVIHVQVEEHFDELVMQLDELDDVVRNVNDVLGSFEVVTADVESTPVFEPNELK